MIVVAGEALVDLVEEGEARRAVPGGGPFNTAIALGRLGLPVAYLGTLSRDDYGGVLAGLLADASVDLSLVRQFALSGTNKIEARVEAFNAFNWFIPGNPGVNLSSGTTFGRITSFSAAASPRVMQFALRYLF